MYLRKFYFIALLTLLFLSLPVYADDHYYYLKMDDIKITEGLIPSGSESVEADLKVPGSFKVER